MDATYGMVYKTMFDNGLEAVMGGHIMLPEYAKADQSGFKGRRYNAGHLKSGNYDRTSS